MHHHSFHLDSGSIKRQCLSSFLLWRLEADASSAVLSGIIEGLWSRALARGQKALPAGSGRLRRGNDFCPGPSLEPTGKAFTMLICVDKIKEKAKNSQAESYVDRLCL